MKAEHTYIFIIINNNKYLEELLLNTQNMAEDLCCSDIESVSS